MTNMDLTQFDELLDQHGPTLDAWPAEFRAMATTLLETSPEAADALADAQTLANLLDAMAKAPAPGYLAGRIAARAGEMEDPWQRLIDWLGARVWRPVLAAGLPLAFGFALGMIDPPSTEEDALLAADVGLMAFSSSYAAIDEELSDEN